MVELKLSSEITLNTQFSR